VIWRWQPLVHSALKELMWIEEYKSIWDSHTECRKAMHDDIPVCTLTVNLEPWKLRQLNVFMCLQKPIIPDTLLPVALGRGKISGAIKELCKCDKCSLATIQSLVCWIFQVPSPFSSFLYCKTAVYSSNYKRLEFFLLWSNSMMMTHLRSADNAIKGKPDSQTLQRIGTFVAPAFKPPG